MLEININRINKNYGFGHILKDISFNVMKGDIISIVGENGSGKSTLLKIIAKEEMADIGTISIRKNSTIGYLKQISEIEDNNTLVKDILYRSIKNITDIQEKLNKYENMMLEADTDKLNDIIVKYSNLQEHFIEIGGYEISEKIGRIVTGFKLQKFLELNYNNLSGGEKRIVNFAAIMIKNPDILLLDEPTNHLDIDTLEWLEDYLKNYKGTILMVSHDRYFLDRITQKTILLENGTINIFNTNYTNFLIENKKRIESLHKDYNCQQKEIKSMQESIKQLRQFGKLGDNEKFFKRANSIEKKLQKTEKISKPKEIEKIPLEFNYQKRSGKNVITIENLNISYGENIIFNQANIKITYGEHACLIGKNGSGKSTLIKTILNNENYLGSNVKIGYIPQEITFENNNTIYEVAKKHFFGEESHLRSALFKFLFNSNDILKKVNSLSGGEKVRLKLFCLMQQDINFLILDEPTNHIDINTRTILEDTLRDYPGTILFVSHDRYFINKLATKIISIENTKLIEYPGNYEDYKKQANKEE